MTSFPELITSTGFLTDRQIRVALEAGYLLEVGTWDLGQLRHASYTLRLGGRVEIARAADTAASETKHFTVYNLVEGDAPLEIRPGDTALLYSLEYIKLPDCVLAFTVARGLLFAEAVSPENTYVDPGFTGNVYTTITNVSNRVVRLQYGMSITRLFFFRLSEPVANGYRAGAALGIAQQLSSIRATPIGTSDECRTAGDKDLLEGMGLIPIGGLHVKEYITRLQNRQRNASTRITVLAVSWPLLLAIANGSTWVQNNAGPFVSNVAASVLATVLTFLTPKVITWMRSERH